MKHERLLRFQPLAAKKGDRVPWDGMPTEAIRVPSGLASTSLVCFMRISLLFSKGGVMSAPRVVHADLY